MPTTPSTTKQRKARRGSKYDSPSFEASTPGSIASPSFDFLSPTPKKGRNAPLSLANDDREQSWKTTQFAQQHTGATNVFLRQQIIDTAFVLYQQPVHVPIIRLASLSGISVQSPDTSNPDDPVDQAKRGTQPIPVFRSYSGQFEPVPASSPAEVCFYQMALYVDGACRAESCIFSPKTGENEVVVLSRCLEDLHAKVSRQLWIRQGVVRAVRRGFGFDAVAGENGGGIGG